VNEHDFEAWSDARSMADLRELTIRWLRGELDETPGYFGPPAPETARLVDTLVAYNALGLLTDQSQPAEPLVEGSSQRANVSGFCDLETAARIEAGLLETELVVVTHEPPRWAIPCTVAITMRCGRAFTWDGGAQGASDILHTWGRICDGNALGELLMAWQVTVIDPVWGRQDHLWPRLLEVLHADPRGRTSVERSQADVSVAEPGARATIL
jgi:hypothetical protein